MRTPLNRLLPENSPAKVLLVEGPDDEHFFRQFFHKHRLEGAEGIRDCAGYDNIRRDLRAFLLQNEATHLAAVVDADDKFESRWESLRGVLLREGFQNVPKRPTPEGTVVQEAGRITVGFWIMPDNKDIGNLEVFIRRLIPTTDTLWEKAEASLNTIPVEERLFGEKDVPKVLLHTWLAWQKEPGKRISQALQATYLDAHCTEATVLADWLRRLFST